MSSLLLALPAAEQADGVTVGTNFVAELMIAFIREHQLIAPLLAASFLVLGIAAVVLGLRSVLSVRKDVGEIRRTEAEGAKVQLENLKQVHDAEDKHAQAAEEWNLRISALVGTLRNASAPSEIDRVREDLIGFYCSDYMPTLGRYLDYYEQVYGAATRADFILSVVLREFENSLVFMSTVNLDILLDGLASAGIKRERFVVSDASLTKVWRFCRANSRFWQLGLKYKLWSARRRLADAARPPMPRKTAPPAITPSKKQSAESAAQPKNQAQIGQTQRHDKEGS